MGEYWNQFLDYINTIGRFLAYQPYSGTRLAPPAEQRYANSHRIDETVTGFPFSHKAQGIEQDQQRNAFDIFNSESRPAKILRYISEPGDTTYIEYPESDKTFGGFIDYRYPRKASTKNQRGKTYKTLRKRYNTAEKLAK